MASSLLSLTLLTMHGMIHVTQVPGVIWLRWRVQPTLASICHVTAGLSLGVLLSGAACPIAFVPLIFLLGYRSLKVEI